MSSVPHDMADKEREDEQAPHGDEGKQGEGDKHSDEGKQGEGKPAPRVLECGLVDVVVHHVVANLLLRAVAQAAVHRNIPHTNSEAIEALRVGLEEHMGKMAPTVGDVVDAVQQECRLFVNSQHRGFVVALSSLATTSAQREEHVQRVFDVLVASGFWRQRARVARALACRVDCRGNDHCTAVYQSEEELAAHRAVCQFRDAPCPNKGCAMIVAARNLGSHHNQCPFAPVECPQCKQPVVRMDLHDHMGSNCPLRLIDCPFKEIGCEETVPQRDSSKHLNDFAHAHMLMCMKQMHKQQAQIQALEGQWSQVQQEVAACMVVQAQLIKDVAAMGKHDKTNASAIAALQKQAKQSEKSLAGLKKAMDGFQKAQEPQ